MLETLSSFKFGTLGLLSALFQRAFSYVKSGIDVTVSNYVSLSTLIVSTNEFFSAPVSSRSAIGTVLRGVFWRNFYYGYAELFGLVFYKRL